MFVQSFAQYSKNWLRRTTIKSILTPKIESTLKPSNYDAKTWFLPFTAQKSKCPRRFWEIEPENLHACLMCPCRAFYQWGLFLFFFPLETWDPLRPNYSNKYKPPKHLAKTNNLKGSAGAHLTRAQNFRVCLSKTVWTSDSEGNWGVMLEPACIYESGLSICEHQVCLPNIHKTRLPRM